MVDLITIVAFGIAALYMGQSLAFIIASRRRHTEHPQYEPSVSVILAARNEAHHLETCLHSLAQLDYPRHKLEIILVDHDSDDTTLALLSRHAGKYRHYKVLQARNAPHGLNGKAQAVALGIEHSCGEIIFLTDADCTVPRTWIKGLLPHFTEGVNAVGGFTIVDGGSGGRRGPLERAQCIDWIYLQFCAAGAAALGRPLSWMGNNLAFRRAAYEEVGGYEKIGFSVTEDFALLQALYKKGSGAVRFCNDPRARVSTQPLRSIGEIVRQRLRWGMGGRSVRLFGKILISTGAATHLLALSALGLALHEPLMLLLPVLLLAADTAMVGRSCREIRRGGWFTALLLFELLFIAYTLTVALMLPFVSSITWKNIPYRVPRGRRRIPIPRFLSRLGASTTLTQERKLG